MTSFGPYSPWVKSFATPSYSRPGLAYRGGRRGVLPRQDSSNPKCRGESAAHGRAPLVADARGVPGRLEQVPERRLLPEQCAEVEIVADVVPARHQRHPGGRAERLHWHCSRPEPDRGQPVEVRGLVRLAAVRRDALVAEVIGHDEDEVRFRLGGQKSRRGRGGQDAARGDEQADLGEYGLHGWGSGSGDGLGEWLAYFLRPCGPCPGRRRGPGAVASGRHRADSRAAKGHEATHLGRAAGLHFRELGGVSGSPRG